ncbi:hypothetical protein H5410_021879 [Solanum commersonii]|uniref:Uncharacterized protein n=1 Tax=Solanum commersonii TaxID=4109 RepID=A0A9J5ZIC6_SOLCO|nr:hypothetical protein H5410_021879 [Solanum commersonii]
MIQNAKMLKVKAKRQGTRPKGGSSSSSAIPTNCIDFWESLSFRGFWRLCSETLNIQRCFWFAGERGRKTKTTKLIVGGIGSTWVHLDKVNPSTSATHSARETEWAK